MPCRGVPDLPSVLARWSEGGGGPVVLIPPDGPPAALYRAAGWLPLPDAPPFHPRPFVPPPPEGNPGAEALLDAVEAILEALGRARGAPVPEGALDRALAGERRVFEALRSRRPPPSLPDWLPPAAALLLLRRGAGTCLPEPGSHESPSPFRDGVAWDGRGDPRLHAALAWGRRLCSVRRSG